MKEIHPFMAFFTSPLNIYTQYSLKLAKSPNFLNLSIFALALKQVIDAF